MVILIAALCMNMGSVLYKNYSNVFDMLTYNIILFNKWYHRFIRLEMATDDIHFRDTYEDGEQVRGLRMQEWRQSQSK